MKSKAVWCAMAMLLAFLPGCAPVAVFSGKAEAPEAVQQMIDLPETDLSEAQYLANVERFRSRVAELLKSNPSMELSEAIVTYRTEGDRISPGMAKDLLARDVYEMAFFKASRDLDLAEVTELTPAEQRQIEDWIAAHYPCAAKLCEDQKLYAKIAAHGWEMELAADGSYTMHQTAAHAGGA